ncbi:MAG: DUF3017 domain-containing protein [Propionibacteriaceae bacterium]|jgi:hypothetical protein|nr:DUF3017 domain-containing protein [Propionibacteriaceae bacterium]
MSDRRPLAEWKGPLGAARRQWPWVVVVALAALGLGLVALGQWRTGLAFLGSAMIVGGLLRWALPAPGILAVRGKALDVALYLGLGLALIVIDAIATVDW